MPRDHAGGLAVEGYNSAGLSPLFQSGLGRPFPACPRPSGRFPKSPLEKNAKQFSPR